MSDLHDYFMAHQKSFSPPRKRGLIQLYESDFASGNGGGQEPSVDEVRNLLQAIQAECDRDGNRYYDIQPGDDRMAVEAFARDLQASHGLIWEHAKQALAALPKAPEPPAPEPLVDPRTYLRGWSTPQHWAGSSEGVYAIDWYAAELGTDFGWITGGHTRGAGVMGPLFLPAAGHDCCLPLPGWTVEFAPNDFKEVPEGYVFLPEGTALYTLILDADDGETMFSFTHVLKEARLDVDVAAFEKFGKVGDSGLEEFTRRGQRPAHTHLAILKDRSQWGRWTGGVGNIRPWDWLAANGFSVRNEGSVPSPMMYMQGYRNTKPY